MPLPTNRTLTVLDRFAIRAQVAASRRRTLYWLGALLWILGLEIGATFSTIPLGTLMPITFPVLVWVKSRLESGPAYQQWCNARLCAELTRVIHAYEDSGVHPGELLERLQLRVSEFRFAPPRLMLTLLQRRTPAMLTTPAALARLEAQLLSVPHGRLIIVSEKREVEVRRMRIIARWSYTFAFVSAGAAILIALLAHRAPNQWHSFWTYTLPAVASVVGIFFSDAADAHDVEMDRYLLMRYELTRTQLESTALPCAKLALFNRLAYEQIIDVIEWWKVRV